ncbi:MAG: hypothetical protein F4Y31_04395 [Gammaproteobacteria bacterium]|nr:hypothetical protein [Chromatiales bacterium]MYA30456.1 hypothetical protein [Gammaproteobacteria bacterium]MYF68182.1 hypothetical protein [Gammaproteobacteria bacterium]MYK37450.1 hypothetical protein [Gammaproteobacteria bacterium]
MRTVGGLFLAVGAVLAGTASADDVRDELLRCAQLQDAQVRLACYDALASVSASAATAPSGASAGASDDGSAAVIADAPDGIRVPAAADRAAPEADSGQSLTDRLFGMLPGRDAGDNLLESRVVGEIRNPRAGTRFTLENGQVWQQTDRTRRNYSATNPRVEIREGFMNSYRMRLEGLNGRIRVRRVK